MEVGAAPRRICIAALTAAQDWMHSVAVYLIAVVLFILSGLLLFAAGSAWAKVARHRESSEEPPLAKPGFRAAAGLTAAALGLLGAAILWALAIAFFLQV